MAVPDSGDLIILVADQNMDDLGRRVSVRACTDPAFIKLRETLTRWFPREVVV